MDHIENCAGASCFPFSIRFPSLTSLDKTKKVPINGIKGVKEDEMPK